MFKAVWLWGLGIVVSAALVIGPAAVYSHVRAARDVVRIRSRASRLTFKLAARARLVLRDIDAKIIEYQDRLGDVADHATAERLRWSAFRKKWMRTRRSLGTLRASSSRIGTITWSAARPTRNNKSRTT